MVDPRRLVDAVDGPAALDFLAKMIRYKSYSGEPGEADLARFMVNEMKTVGLKAELSPVPKERFNAIGTLKGTAGGKSSSEMENRSPSNTNCSEFKSTTKLAER